MRTRLVQMAVILFVISQTYAQNTNLNILEVQQLMEKYSTENLFESGVKIIDDFKICSESFEWDTLSNQFVFSGESLISYQEMGNYKLLSIEISEIDEGEENFLKIDNYFSFQEISIVGAFLPDSSLVYFGDGQGNYELITKSINHFENEKVVLSEEYFDYSAFGLPIGFVKAGESRYFYDQNDFLITKVSDNLNFDTFILEFSDSTVYTNNAMGLPVVEIGYDADFFTGEIGPDYKTEYTYVNQYFVSEELGYGPQGESWIKNYRFIYSYDDQNRRTGFLAENTQDDGHSWLPQDRSQAVFDANLPFNVPSRELSQLFIGGEWVNSDLTTYEDCTAGLHPLNTIEFKTWMDQSYLYIEGNKSFENVILTLYSVDGFPVFEQYYEYLPYRINLDHLNAGVYFINLKSKGLFGTKKVFKL